MEKLHPQCVKTGSNERALKGLRNGSRKREPGHPGVQTGVVGTVYASEILSTDHDGLLLDGDLDSIFDLLCP